MTDNAELLNMLNTSPSEAESLLISNNLGLVRGIVARYNYTGYDSDDLIQIGTIGLLKAIRRFDKGFNVRFSTYAVPVIIGEIKRFIRDDGIIKVSRTHKTNAMKIRLATQKLTQSLNRNPTVSELSAECNIPNEDILVALEATQPVESIYKATTDGETEVNLKADTENDEANIINRIAVGESLEILSQKERTVIALRYFGEKTQSQISKKIGVSQVQVSRIEKAALQKLRDYMKS